MSVTISEIGSSLISSSGISDFSSLDVSSAVKSGMLGPESEAAWLS